MLFYSSNKSLQSNLNIKKERPKKQEQESSFFASIWWRIAKVILNFIISILSSILGNFVNLVAPGLGLAVEFLINNLFDLVINLIENNGKINWVDFAVQGSYNAASAILKGFKYVRNLKKVARISTLADNIKTQDKEFKNTISKSSADLIKFGTTKQYAKIANYKVFEEKYAVTLNRIIKQEQTFKNSTIELSRIFEKTKNIVHKANKIALKFRLISTLIFSPRFAAKKAVQLLIKKPQKYLVKKWNLFIDDKIKKIVKIGKDSFNDSLKNIPLPSKWLRSISFFAGHNPWDFARTSAIVYFKPKPTNNKAPVFLFQKNTNLLAGFLGCESPGRYYLDNFAWGWSIGKIIRKYSKFMSFYRIPLFSNLLETILFFNGMFISLTQALKERKNKWINNENLGQELLFGLRDGLAKGWNFKYLKPLVGSIRAGITKNYYYATASGANFAKKSLLRYRKNKTLNIIRSYKKKNEWRNK